MHNFTSEEILGRFQFGSVEASLKTGLGRYGRGGEGFSTQARSQAGEVPR
jgi:hypothetical protein